MTYTTALFHLLRMHRAEQDKARKDALWLAIELVRAHARMEHVR